MVFGCTTSLIACGDSNSNSSNSVPSPSTVEVPVFDNNQFLNSDEITNDYFPLTPGEFRSYTKTEGDEVVAVIEQRVLDADPDNTISIEGIEKYLVVEEIEFENGEVAETNRDYYAQDTSGNVWQLGNSVLAYEDGYDAEGGDNEGSWIAGVEGAVAGLIMPAMLQIGQKFSVSGELDAVATIVDLNQVITTPYDGTTNKFDENVDSTFSNVVSVEHSVGATVEDTIYFADGIGLISGFESPDAEGEQEEFSLFSFATAAFDNNFDSQNFSNSKPSSIEDLNPYLPLFPGNKWVYLKETEDGIERITTQVSTTKIREIMGVQVIVVDDIVEVMLEGEDEFVLEEKTEDYYAMDDEGNIWYMGEESSHFDPETGEFERDGGSWIAGETEDELGNLAQPGVLMYASPVPGMLYRQEYLFGIAEDMATVISNNFELELETSVDGTIYSIVHDDVLKTHEYAAHELSVTESLVTEFKYYVQGIGKVIEESPNDEEVGILVEFVDASMF